MAHHLPPLFPKEYLSNIGNVQGTRSPPRRARTVTPIGHGSAHTRKGETHLTDALQLALGIAQRLQKEGHKFNLTESTLANDLALILSGKKKVFDVENSSNNTAATGSNESPKFPLPSITHTLPSSKHMDKDKESSFDHSLEDSFDSKKAPTMKASLSPRQANLFHKLKQATAASFVYKEMADSKDDIHRLTQFTIDCSSAALDGATIAKVIKEQLTVIDPSVKATDIHVFCLDPAEMLVDPMSGKMVSPDDSTPEGRSRKKTEPFVDGGAMLIPLISRSTNLFVGCISIDNGKDLAPGVLQKISSITSIAAMALRNLLLHENVKWQVEKAEAMLMMANQLSRDNLDERILAESIMQTAKQLTDSDRCSIFLVNGNTLQAYFEGQKAVTLSIDSGIAGHVAKTGEVVNIHEAYADARFNSAVDKATGYKTKTILCMPVHYEGAIVAVAQLINKKPKQGRSGNIEQFFSKRDEELFHTFSTFAGVSLRNCRINANLVQEKKKSEAILDVVHLLSDTDIRDVNGIVSHVMLGAKKLLNADRSSLFLFDKERDELYSKVADKTGGKEIRFSSGKGIAGTVAKSGIAENITDAYEDERFNREVDKAFNYRTRSILCEPITCKGDVLAVAQLVNRIDAESGDVTAFTSADQETFRTFAMFAGISISNSHLLEFAVKAGQEAMELNQKRQGGMVKRPSSGNVTLRPVQEEEKAPIRSMEVPEATELTSRNFDFFGVRESTDSPLNAAVAVSMKVIMSTGLPKKFGCPEDVLLTFVCQCRRRYRNVPYHNFFHAVDVCQTVHTFLYEGKIAEFLTDLECFVLLITALVHDLDHMGLNNSFHLKTDSPLGILSSASGNNSVLEVHHCNLAIEILEDPRSNVFVGLDADQTKHAYRTLIDCVLATDMAKHGEIMNSFADVKELKKEEEADRMKVMEMVVKAADISNVTKPFEVSKKWAMAVTEEFYQQGDKEKQQGVAVLPMFDRSANNELAKGQIGFIDFMAMKFFKILADKLPSLQWTVDNIVTNKEQWSVVLEIKRRASLADIANTNEKK